MRYVENITWPKIGFRNYFFFRSTVISEAYVQVCLYLENIPIHILYNKLTILYLTDDNDKGDEDPPWSGQQRKQNRWRRAVSPSPGPLPLSLPGPHLATNLPGHSQALLHGLQSRQDLSHLLTPANTPLFQIVIK